MSKCLALLLLATSQYLTFYDRDNGQTAHVSAGQVVTIKLMVPQGVRSGWQPVRLDHGRLIPMGGPTLEPGGSVPGTDCQVFQFRTVGEGRTTLELQYVRPIQREYNPPLRLFRLQIIVTG